jgi:hypothetical protein
LGGAGLELNPMEDKMGEYLGRGQGGVLVVQGSCIINTLDVMHQDGSFKF